MPPTGMVLMIAITFCLLGGFALLIRFLSGWLLHRTLGKAIERGSAAAPALIDRIGPMESGRSALGNDDRHGMVLIALAIADVLTGVTLAGPAVPATLLLAWLALGQARGERALI